MQNNVFRSIKSSLYYLALAAILTSVSALSGCSKSNENTVANVAVDPATAAAASAKGAAESAASEQARAQAAQQGAAAVAQQHAKAEQ